MKKLSATGFTTVVAIAIVAMILAGLSGFYVWNKNNQNQNNTQTTQTENTSQETADLSEGGKYLIIKEWGLRITLPEYIKGDISYFINDIAERTSGGPLRVDFLSRRFSSGSLKCAVVEESNPRTIVGFYRQGVGEGASGDTPTFFKSIGDYKYYFITPSCEEIVNKEGTDEDKKLIADLKAAISNTLEAYTARTSN